MAYHGITHVSPDMSASVDKITYKVRELELHVFKSDRPENYSVRPVINTLAVGAQKLKSSTLATFNSKVKGILAGKEFRVEEDEIPPTNFNFSDESNETFNHTV